MAISDTDSEVTLTIGRRIVVAAGRSPGDSTRIFSRYPAVTAAPGRRVNGGMDVLAE